MLTSNQFAKHPLTGQNTQQMFQCFSMSKANSFMHYFFIFDFRSKGINFWNPLLEIIQENGFNVCL